MPIINVNGHSIETDENGKPYWNYKTDIHLARFLLKNKIIKITFNEDEDNTDYVWMNLHSNNETISVDEETWDDIESEKEFFLGISSKGLVSFGNSYYRMNATLKAYDDWMKKEDHDYKEYERLKKKFG